MDNDVFTLLERTAVAMRDSAEAMRQLASLQKQLAKTTPQLEFQTRKNNILGSGRAWDDMVKSGRVRVIRPNREKGGPSTGKAIRVPSVDVSKYLLDLANQKPEPRALDADERELEAAGIRLGGGR